MEEKRAQQVRKYIHFFTGLLIFLLTYLLERDVLLWLIITGSIFAFISFPLRQFSIIHKGTYRSFGTLFYPVGILSAYLILYNLPIYFFQTSLMVLTISDTLANTIGRIKNGNGRFFLITDTKSMHGIAAFVVTSLIIFYLLLPLAFVTNVYFLFFLLLYATVLEIFSWRGSDNLTIPVGLAFFFWVSQHYAIDYTYLAAVFFFMSAGGVFLFKLKLLTLNGSIAAWLLGNYLLMLLGPTWTIPVLAFFFTSVALTKLRAAVNRKNKGESNRNAWQVTANILWAVVSSALYLISGHEIFAYLFIAFLAAVTADTWASEAGPLFTRRSFSLADCKSYPAGTTGGISLPGTIAALAGSAFISFTSMWLMTGSVNPAIASIITLAAFLACFVDSLLGAFVENKLLGLSFFQKAKGAESISPNDLVNLGGSLSAAGFFLVLYYLYY